MSFVDAEKLDSATAPGAVARPRILFLVAADYRQLEIKGVAPLILERDEGGFFERVVTVHPIARSNRRLDLNTVHRVEEMHLSRPPWFPRALIWILAPIHLVAVIFRVRHLLREERIDLVRATDPYFMGLIGWIVTRMPRLPFCVSLHADYDKAFALDGPAGGPTIMGSRRLAKSLERFVLRRADLVLPIREYLAKKVIADGVPDERVRIIPHGINLRQFIERSQFDFRRHYGIAESCKIISFVGRLERGNYVGDVIELARRLVPRSDCVVVVVGGGSEKKRLADAVKTDAALRELVIMTGFLPRDQVAALRQQSTVALCLMGGFSLIEACAAGCPAVSYDVEWHRELVHDDTTGFLVPEHDIDELTERVVALLDDQVAAHRMGVAAQQLVCLRHDLEQTSVIKRECYRNLLAHSAGAA